MIKTVTYRTITIKSDPSPQREEGWKPVVTIYWGTGGSLTMQNLSASTMYKTEEEAHIQGIKYAERIIDERTAG